MSLRPLLLIGSLALSSCATVSEDAKSSCPKPPPPPEHLMKEVKADYLERMKSFLYE